jgi:hypothetical protein
VHEHAGSSAGRFPSQYPITLFTCSHLLFTCPISARQKTIAITGLVTIRMPMERLPVPRSTAEPQPARAEGVPSAGVTSLRGIVDAWRNGAVGGSARCRGALLIAGLPLLIRSRLYGVWLSLIVDSGERMRA